MLGLLISCRPGLPARSGESEPFPPAIEDNSFFIEEAYNQETGVVQHIFNALYFRLPGRTWSLSLTEEWPLGGVKHQFSYTIPFSILGRESLGGFGDILLNYRFQLLDRSQWAAMAPRVSLILPSGNEANGLGSGVPGLQVNLPASRRVSRRFAVHANAGFTTLPGVRVAGTGRSAVRRTFTSCFVGGSVIWLATSRFNVMLEALHNLNAELGDDLRIRRQREFILSPGIRRAFDIGNLQMVAGAAIPLRFRESRTDAGAFLYLSFEHPF